MRITLLDPAVKTKKDVSGDVVRTWWTIPLVCRPNLFERLLGKKEQTFYALGTTDYGAPTDREWGGPVELEGQWEALSRRLTSRAQQHFIKKLHEKDQEP